MPEMEVSSMPFIRQLYELQGLDLKVSDAEKSLADVRFRLGDKSELTLAGERVGRAEARLKELAAQARADLGDSATKQAGSGVRPPGRLK